MYISASDAIPKAHLAIQLELYTRVKDAYEHGKLDDVDDGDLILVAGNFGASLSTIPGNREAFRLVASWLGIDVHVLFGLCAHMERERPGMSGTLGLCRNRHRHNWNVPDLPETGVDTAPSSRVKTFRSIRAFLEFRQQRLAGLSADKTNNLTGHNEVEAEIR